MSEARALWRDWLREALRMGVTPREFWGLSVREWRFALSASPQRFARDDLLGLMMRFPDDV